MKKISWPVLVGSLALVAAVAGCGLLNSGGSSFAVSFYSNAASTTPVFKPISASASAIASAAASWESGGPLYRVYFSLREFLASRDEGRVDRSNLYKLLIDVDSVFSGLSGSAAPIATQEVTPPFAALPKVTCDKAKNDTAGKKAIAMTETSAEVNAIITWIWSDSSTKEEYGIASIKYGKLTHDITIDMTYSVDYDLSSTATDYNLRCYVTGNTGTNSFEYKYLVGDDGIVAKGISRGAGNYMLFKYRGVNGPVQYIVASAEADESFFKGQFTTPTAIYATTEVGNLPTSEVGEYKDWVETTAFFTAADLVTDISVLNSGNPRQGTIYLNYN